MVGQYGRLYEGDEKLIGIEKQDCTVIYKARCRLCHFRSFPNEHEEDAQQVMQQHVEGESHKRKIASEAVSRYEDTITVHKAQGERL